MVASKWNFLLCIYKCMLDEGLGSWLIYLVSTEFRGGGFAPRVSPELCDWGQLTAPFWSVVSSSLKRCSLAACLAGLLGGPIAETLQPPWVGHREGGWKVMPLFRCVFGVCLVGMRAATFLIVFLTAGHFTGNNTVLEVLRHEGYEVEHVPAGRPINK